MPLRDDIPVDTPGRISFAKLSTAFDSLHQKHVPGLPRPSTGPSRPSTDELDVPVRIDQLTGTAQKQAQHMSSAFQIEIEMPDDLAQFRLPEGVQERLTTLLDKQDGGQPLTDSERREAEGLVNLADLLSLLRLRAERVSGHHAG